MFSSRPPIAQGVESKSAGACTILEEALSLDFLCMVFNCAIFLFSRGVRESAQHLPRHGSLFDPNMNRLLWRFSGSGWFTQLNGVCLR